MTQKFALTERQVSDEVPADLVLWSRRVPLIVEELVPGFVIGRKRVRKIVGWIRYGAGRPKRIGQVVENLEADTTAESLFQLDLCAVVPFIARAVVLRYASIHRLVIRPGGDAGEFARRERRLAGRIPDIGGGGVVETLALLDSGGMVAYVGDTNHRIR